MPLKQILIVLFIALNMVSFKTLAHTKKISIDEVSALAKEANRLMKEGNYEKSLIQSRLALSKAIQLKNDNLIAS